MLGENEPKLYSLTILWTINEMLGKSLNSTCISCMDFYFLLLKLRDTIVDFCFKDGMLLVCLGYHNKVPWTR